MSDDHDWVARLLAAAPAPQMPDDVAGRLQRTLRQEAERLHAGPEAAGPAGPTTGPTAGATETGTGTPTAGEPAPGLRVVPSAAAGAEPSPAPSRLDRVTGSGDADDVAGARAAAATLTPTSDVLAPRGHGLGVSRREQRADDRSERRRRLLARWAPVAAGVLVLGGAGLVALSLDGGGGGSADLTTAGAEQEARAEVAADAAAPRALVATGTDYSTTDRDVFDAQVRALVAVAGSDSAEGASEAAQDSGSDAASGGAAAASSPAPAVVTSPEQARQAAAGSPLSDRDAFTGCVDALTAGGTAAAAVDLAVVDGVAATVVVVPDPAGEAYQVYVVGPDCTGLDGTQFDFFTVDP